MRGTLLHTLPDLAAERLAQFASGAKVLGSRAMTNARCKGCACSLDRIVAFILIGLK